MSVDWPVDSVADVSTDEVDSLLKLVSADCCGNGVYSDPYSGPTYVLVPLSRLVPKETVEVVT